MAEIASAGGRVWEGEAALARGALAEAPGDLRGGARGRRDGRRAGAPGWATWWIEDVPVCLDARERAYRRCRRMGDRRRAPMMALWLGDDHLVIRGERAVANGWFQRAARLLEERLLSLVTADELGQFREEGRPSFGSPAAGGTTFTLLQCWGRCAA